MTLWHTFCCFSIVRVSDNHWTYASVHTLKSFNAELLTCTVYMSVYIHVRNVHASTHMRRKFTVCDQYTVDSIRLSEVVCIEGGYLHLLSNVVSILSTVHVSLSGYSV